MPESIQTKLTRWYFHIFPCYAATRGRITYIASDWKELRVELPLSLFTRNYIGTIFGGSMFAATDPFYMFMLIKILGPDYVVWDKAGSIRFKRPGRTRLYARFVITDEEVQEIRDALTTKSKFERTFKTTLVDKAGEIHAEIERLVHVHKADSAKP
jgi:hypothetical protein